MILVAIGSNLPGPDGASPLQNCQRAVMMLDRLPGLRLRGLSAWYQTAPVPVSDQPHYVNAVAHLIACHETESPDPSQLLRALQAIEATGGRERGEPNAARTLDLDIIAMGRLGSLVRHGPDPILPHPRADQRAFVLQPLRDVAPHWLHPVLRRTANELLDAVSSVGVCRL